MVAAPQYPQLDSRVLLLLAAAEAVWVLMFHTRLVLLEGPVAELTAGRVITLEGVQ